MVELGEVELGLEPLVEHLLNLRLVVLLLVLQLFAHPVFLGFLLLNLLFDVFLALSVLSVDHEHVVYLRLEDSVVVENFLDEVLVVAGHLVLRIAELLVLRYPRVQSVEVKDLVRHVGLHILQLAHHV